MANRPYADKHPCRWARQQLDDIIQLDKDRPDALPGSFMKLIKEAKKLLVKRQKRAARRIKVKAEKELA